MKIAIIGTGAIGGFYGAHLVKHGHDVHFLLNTDYEHVKRNGLVIDLQMAHLSFQKLMHTKILKTYQNVNSLLSASKPLPVIY